MSSFDVVSQNSNRLLLSNRSKRKIKMDKNIKNTIENIQNYYNIQDNRETGVKQIIVNNINNNININIHQDKDGNTLSLNQNTFTTSNVQIYKTSTTFPDSFKKFKIALNSLKFISRIKIRVVNYGSTLRRPKFIERNDLNLFYTKLNATKTKSKKQNDNKSTQADSISTYSSINLTEERNKLPWYILNPDARWLTIWNYVNFILSAYLIIVVPLRVAFNDDLLVKGEKLFPFDVIVELFFIFDFIFNCITSYYQDDGHLERNLKLIIKRYFNGYMILDFVGIFPFYAFKWDINSNKTNILLFLKATKLYGLPKKFDKIKLSENCKIFQGISSKLSDYSGIIKILFFILNTYVICHLFACIWFLTAKLDGMNPNTWIARRGLVDESDFICYVQSLYFSFTVFLTVGYGDIYAGTRKEVLIMCFWLIFCGIYYSFNLSSLGSVFEDENAKAIEINEAIQNLKELSKRNKFPKLLEDKIKNHITKEMNKKVTKNKNGLREIFSELAIDLKHQIALDIYDHKIKTIKIFSQCTKEFVSNFVPLLELKEFDEHCDVYHVKEVPENIFFILSGEVYNITEDKIPFCLVSQGSYFGDIEILRKTYRETGITTKTKVKCLLMKKSLLFDDLIKNDQVFLVKLIENMVKRHKSVVQMKKIIQSIIEIGNKNKYFKYSVDDYNREDKSKWEMMKYYTGLEILMTEEEKGTLEDKEFTQLFRSVSRIEKENFEKVKIEEKQKNLIMNKYKAMSFCNQCSSTITNMEMLKEVKQERFSVDRVKENQFDIEMVELRNTLIGLKDENVRLIKELRKINSENAGGNLKESSKRRSVMQRVEKEPMVEVKIEDVKYFSENEDHKNYKDKEYVKSLLSQ